MVWVSGYVRKDESVFGWYVPVLGEKELSAGQKTVGITLFGFSVV